MGSGRTGKGRRMKEEGGWEVAKGRVDEGVDVGWMNGWMWGGCGVDVGWMWGGCGVDVGWMWGG